MNDAHLDVLIACRPADVHGDIVAEALRARGVGVAIADCESIRRMAMTWSPGQCLRLADPARGRIIDSTTTVWWRRPGRSTAVELSRDEAELVGDEVAVLLPGTLEAVGVRW